LIEDEETADDHNSFLEYTRQLEDPLDCGSLTHINYRFFVLLVNAEKIVKPFFESQYQRSDLKDYFMALLGLQERRNSALPAKSSGDK
jgi:hypothetical protein